MNINVTKAMLNTLAAHLARNLNGANCGRPVYKLDRVVGILEVLDILNISCRLYTDEDDYYIAFRLDSKLYDVKFLVTDALKRNEMLRNGRYVPVTVPEDDPGVSYEDIRELLF